jgi:triacylglycerol lipase
VAGPAERRARSGLPPLSYTGHWKPPIWLESRVAAELSRLQRDPVFQGRGVPRGDGSPVLLVPGFLAGDGSLAVLHDWLRRIGYTPAPGGIFLNVHYSEVVLRGLSLRLVDLYGWAGRKVSIVGHSRGGIIAKVLSQRHPEMVRRVVTLGSPLADPYDVHPLTMAGVRLAHVFNLLWHRTSSRVELDFLRDLAAPPLVPVVSIYSRSDGIVHWEACVRPDVTSVEVRGSHVGLAVNAEVYSLLGHLLKQDGEPRRRAAKG